jgi:hypothetical protein
LKAQEWWDNPVVSLLTSFNLEQHKRGAASEYLNRLPKKEISRNTVQGMMASLDICKLVSQQD